PKIGVLVLVQATGRKIDLPVVLVHMQHFAYHPLALGKLFFHLAALPVIEVEMVPSIPFRGPEDLLAIIEVKPVLFAAVVDKGIAALIDKDLYSPAGRIHFDDLVGLVPPLVVLEGKGPAVLPPGHGGQSVLVIESLGRNLQVPVPLQEEQLWTLEGQFIPGFQVIPGLELGL